MRFFYPTIICLLPWILYSDPVKAQCNNGTQPECACETAPVLCTIDQLDNYSFSMTSFQHPEDGPSPICPGANQSQTNNPTWFAFTAWCTDLTLRVSAENCVAVGGYVGFQLAIYEDCTFNNPVACNADIDDCNEDDKILNINGLDIGDVYYFFVDGCLGSYCDVIIDVIGTCGQEEIAPWTQQVNGDVNPCAGQSVTYDVEDLDGAGTYHWFLDGELVDLTSGTSIELAFPDAGTYQLCVDASNDPCVPVTNDPPQLCTTINVYTAEAGLINAVPSFICINETATITASGFNTGPDNVQALLITHESGLIVDVITAASGTFSTTMAGTYTIYSFNYIPALTALPAIGSNIAGINCNTACCDLASTTITVQQITASYSAIECNDNGTGDDPSDDTFYFLLQVSGSGAAWEATDGSLAGLYDQAQVCGPYLISNGVLNLALEDIDIDGCLAVINVNPPLPCSACNQVVDAGPGFTLNCYASTTSLIGMTTGMGDYYWTGPANFLDTGFVATVTDSGWYFFTAEFADACTFTDSAYVSIDMTAPVADAGPDLAMDCHGNQVLLDGSGSSGNFLSLAWLDAGGDVIAHQALHHVSTPGVYIMHVLNTGNGCVSNDTMILHPDTNSLLFVTAGLMPEHCVDENNGSIIIEAVSGGSPPYSYALNETVINTDGIFFDLQPGEYHIHIVDDAGCELDTFFTIATGVDLQLQLPPLLEVTEGETEQIQAMVNVPFQQLHHIQWSPAGIIACDTCLTTTIQPTTNQLFELTIMHLNGCEASAAIQINVVDKPQIYIPTVFSPNADGYNDHFTLYANDRVEKIIRLDVFDRWGEHVFHHADFDPNSPADGWDGKFRDRLMHPASFVYVFELLMRDGTTLFRRGDITIIR
jgi:gliding motility-associated-like protein